MCGRFAQPKSTKDIVEEFNVDQIVIGFKPSYNIAPTHNVAVIIKNGKKKLTTFRWGLIPFWAKDISIGSRMINTRSETIHEKPSFRNSFQKRRCLIVANGFFEWKREGNRKIPMYFYLKDRELFGFAGIYDIWRSPEGDTLKTCSIITTDANEVIKPIHNRMPVILPRKEEPFWLDNSVYGKDKLLSILQPYNSNEISYHRVSNYVNSPQNNSIDCIKPI